MPGGIAAKSGKLRMGDRILKVNGTDVTKATHQEAVMELLRPGDQIVLTVQHDPLPENYQVSYLYFNYYLLASYCTYIEGLLLNYKIAFSIKHAYENVTINHKFTINVITLNSQNLQYFNIEVWDQH